MPMLSFVPKVDDRSGKEQPACGTPVRISEPTKAEANGPDLPIAEVKPAVPQAGFWARTCALLRFLCQTEVHTYAFSVAANAILSLFPFIVLLLTITRRVFHSRSMEVVLGDLMRSFLPTGQEFVMRNMATLAHPHKSMQAVSIFMLLVSSTGIFLPLEVALNNVWGVRTNRSYLHNQAVSLLLAFSVGLLALASVAMTAGHPDALAWVARVPQDNIFLNALVSQGGIRITGLLASICLFFLIYWVLPNRKVPALAVLPTAIVVGVLWDGAKYLYVRALPILDFQSVYGPFYISVGLMIWAFLSGLLVLAGAHFSATRYALRTAREAERES